MISYAQNREDVVLARAFANQLRGFYIDIGAEHPQYNSVTKHFYDEGWRGINVEPSQSMLAELERERPLDTNLGVGVAEAEGKLTFYEGPPENHGSSTFRADLAAQYQRHGVAFTAVDDVAVTTLDLLFEEYVGDRRVDFLKIDVEGLETAVIVGAEWQRWRPRVIVVKSTGSESSIDAHSEWEPVLNDASYVPALFDGINRFYVLANETDLLERLSRPASVLDEFTDASHLAEVGALQAAVVELEHVLEVERTTIARLETTSAQAEAMGHRIKELLRELHQTQDRLAASMDDLREADVAAVALRKSATDHHVAQIAAERERDQARQETVAIVAELDRFKATWTLRLLHGPRRLYGSLRGRKVY